MVKQKLYRSTLMNVCIFFLTIVFCSCSFNSSSDKMYKAIEFGNIEAVKEAVNDGYDINAFKSKKVNVWDMSAVDSPLVAAMFNNRYDIAEYLIEQGADTNYISPSGKSVLTYLIENYEYVDIYELLIEKGADVNYVNSDGISLLELALDYNHDKSIHALLNSNNIIISDKVVNILLNNLKNNDYYYEGYGYLREILKHSKNIDSQIYNSIFNSNILLNEDIKEENRKIIICCTASFGETDTLKKIIQNSDYDINNLYILACEYGNIKNIQFLLSIGADINTSDKNGVTAIERAMRYNQYDTVKYLLENGASTRGEKGTNYDDILCYAAMNNNYDITKMLIEKYNDNLNMDRALYIAVFYNNYLALKAFLDTGTDVNKPINDCTLLELACVLDNGSICAKLLLDYGANVNGTNGQPLIEAVKYGNIDTVKILIDYDVDINYNLSNGGENVTALYYASTMGYYDIVKVLVNNGATFFNQQEIEKAMFRIKLSDNIYNYLLENKLI